MEIQCNVETTFLDSEIIWYEKDGFRVSFIKDEANPDYQAYLKRDEPETALSTPMVIDDPKS
jgi:hypothetical protein